MITPEKFRIQEINYVDITIRNNVWFAYRLEAIHFDYYESAFQEFYIRFEMSFCGNYQHLRGFKCKANH